jgi:ribulose-phosphate 3-epimerase
VGTLSEVWEDLDYAVVMSVNPGWGGQAFLAPSVSKVRRLRDEALGSGARLSIEVDGGVATDNAAALCSAGAEILVAGTSVYGAGDPSAAIGKLREAARVSVRA